MEHKNIDGEEAMMLEIASLVDEQVIWVPLEHNMCKDLKYVVFKVSGFRNTVMSYLNSTNEMANFLNFEKLTEKIAALSLDYFDPVTITTTQPGSSTLTKTLQVFGVGMNISPNSWRVAFTTLEPIIDAFILDSALYGLLDTDVLSY